MELEKLIRDPELDRAQKELSEALDIAEREWEKVRTSLELCGDIGEFNKEDFMVGIIEEDVIVRQPLRSPTKSVSGYSPTFYPMYFVRNLLLMEDKFSHHNYKTVEALYVFVELTVQAALRLGLEGNFAMGFASGYGNVRTGWIAEKGWPEEREVFSSIFFRGRRICHDWEFFWNSTKTSLKKAYDKFKNWQENPQLHKKETRSDSIVKPFIV